MMIGGLKDKGEGGAISFGHRQRDRTPRKKNLHAKLGVFEITELWEKEGNRYRMLLKF